MTMKWLNRLILMLMLCVSASAARDAVADITVSWPTDQWVALPDPCTLTGTYTEPHDDFPGASGHHELDIVGDATHPAGFRYTDGTNLFFRMRVDKATGTTDTDNVWQFLLDTDKDSQGYVDYSLQLDNKTDDAVEFIPATSGGPLFSQVKLQHNKNDGHWSGDIAIYSQITVDTGDVNLGDTGPNDTWLDVAMPWTEFTSKTGIANSSAAFYDWRVYLTTSDSHITVNKDTPDCVVPEPSTFILFSSLFGALGICVGWRRMRRAA